MGVWARRDNAARQGKPHWPGPDRLDPNRLRGAIVGIDDPPIYNPIPLDDNRQETKVLYSMVGLGAVGGAKYIDSRERQSLLQGQRG